MKLQDAIKLINHSSIYSNIPQHWADLGCGSGLFTHALATLLPKDSIIYAIDKNIKAFDNFIIKGINIQKMQLDFITADIKLKDLDGILMANSLHYVKDKSAFIDRLSVITKPSSSLIIAEYDTNTASRWVPYPLSLSSLQTVFVQKGYKEVVKLNEHPSVYQEAGIYSAVIKK